MGFTGILLSYKEWEALQPGEELEQRSKLGVTGPYSAREKCAWVLAMSREAGLNVSLRGLDLILRTRKSHRRHLEQGTLIRALVYKSHQSEGRTWKAKTGPLK